MTSSWKIKRAIVPYVFIAPFFILFAIFMLYPFVYNLVLSLYSWDGIGQRVFIGISNFKDLLSDPIFIQTILNTLIIFILHVPLMIFLALLLGFILNSKSIKGKGLFRAVFFIPNITSTVAVASIFMLIFDMNYGILNKIIGYVGVSNISWLGHPMYSRIALSILIIWRWVGYNMIIMLGGLQNIDRQLFEAAEIDGASKAQVFFSVVMPMMRPIILFCIVLSTIGTFTLFAEPMILTKGGPMNATLTPVLYIYNNAFEYLNMGYASSISLIFFVIMLIITAIQFKINKALD